MALDLAVEDVAPAPGLSGGALKSLGVGGMDLGGQWNAAAATKKAAMEKISATGAAKEAALAPVEQKISALPAQAPANPKYEAVPDKMEHMGLDPAQLNEATQTLFALAAIGGAMTRQPVTAALNAFSGGVQGLMKGDQALFQREAQTFDRNLRQAIAKNQQAAQEYTAAWEKHKMDATTLQNEWNLIARKYNDTVASANIQAKDASDMMKHVENLVKMAEQGETARRNLEAQTSRLIASQAGQDRRLEATLAARASEGVANRESKEFIAGQKLDGRQDKPSASERQHYVDANQLLTSVDRIKKMLEKPELRQKIDESRLGAVLSDTVESKLLQQYLVRPNLDQDVKQYLNEVLMLRNQYYLDQSGKAVTGGEALRNYGAVVQPGDTSDDVLLKMSVASERTKAKMGDMEKYFPGLAVIRGGGAKPGGPAALPAKNDKGWSLMTDAKGNRAYVGPNNEVEEVK